VNNKV